MQWSLEDIYKKQVRGNIPPRKHLHVLGEASYEEVVNLLSNFKDKEEELEYIKQYLDKRPHETGVMEYLRSKNLNEATLEEGNVLQKIVDIMHSHGDLEKYAKYINSPKAFPRAVRDRYGRYARSGDLIKEMERSSGLKKETLSDLILLKGSESGRGVGRGEVAMAAIFSDVKMMEGAGDLDWNDQYLEVKGTSARLGESGRDREFVNFETSILGKLATRHNVEIRQPGGIATMINVLAKIKEVDRNELVEAVRDFTKKAYSNHTIEIPGNLDLTDYNIVRNTLSKAYASTYANRHNVVWFIMINTSSTKSFGRYYLFNPAGISSFVDDGVLGVSPIAVNQLDPSLNVIK